jgi:hypothetical protein
MALASVSMLVPLMVAAPLSAWTSGTVMPSLAARCSVFSAASPRPRPNGPRSRPQTADIDFGERLGAHLEGADAFGALVHLHHHAGQRIALGLGPTSKEELRAFVNTRFQEEHNLRCFVTTEERDPIDTPDRESWAEAQGETGPTFTAAQIEEFILDRATVAEAGNILECLGTRFAELAKAVRS